jgi:DNA mismatch repair protein MutL
MASISKIIVLPEHLANKIAAGEVVERPASVVKELVENAIDAQSYRISISLLEGGIRQIQVQDDGAGMSRDEATLCFLRHATSKISKEEDLAAITTLGFRGEALPSIASVSQIRLVTQQAGSEEGSEIILSGGQVTQVRGIGAPVGSTFEVSDLFFNTPARQKFLKSVSTELSHISQSVFQLALAHSSIHFQLTHQGKTLLSAPSVSNQKDRLLQLYGNEIVNSCMEVRRSFLEGAINLHCFFTRAPVPKSPRRDQLIFVNGRSVKSPLISHAVYDAYGSFLVKGDHPFFAIFLSIDPARIDVNVHPTKREVRFQNTDELYRLVKQVIREGLASAPNSAASPQDTSTKEALSRSMASTPERSAWIGWPSGSPPAKPVVREIGTQNSVSASQRTEDFFQSVLPDTGLIVRALGQIYGTFILAEMDGEFVVIDQHTAHERILYEAFLKKWKEQGAFSVQPLLIPRQIDLTLAQGAVLCDQIGLLKEVGLFVEPFGDKTVLVREVPVELSGVDLEAFLVDLAETLTEVEVTQMIDQPRHKMIASMACHAAVRAHQILTLPEMDRLLHDYFDRKTPPTCPHGRPIVMKYPLAELKKQFRRN